MRRAPGPHLSRLSPEVRSRTWPRGSLPHAASLPACLLLLGCAPSPKMPPVRVQSPLLADTAGGPGGCSAAGITAREGEHTSEDPVSSTATLSAHCRQGHTASCMALGEMYLAGCGVSRSAARAAELFQHACRAGSSVSCGELGILRLHSEEQDHGIEEESDETARLLLVGCDAGHAAACRRLGEILGFAGPPLLGDPEWALQLFERACDHGDPQACRLAARSYLESDATEANVLRSYGLYRRACLLDGSCSGGRLPVEDAALPGFPSETAEEER